MSLNHAAVVSHVPQSLPSFAQAFSNRSLSSLPATNNALPPIQTRFSPANDPPDDPAPPKPPSRKRSRGDPVSSTRDRDEPTPEASPRLVHIKEEDDQQMLDPTPPPLAKAPPPNSPSPPASPGPTPSKKRRVTVSGHAPPTLNVDVRVSNEHACSTPISPVVMGFTIQRDNPSAIEQVKGMINVKQKQKALIEQRRGSIAGVSSPTTVTPSPIPASPALDRTTKPHPSTRSSRRSPNTAAASSTTVLPRRPGGVTPVSARPTSPTTSVAISQPSLTVATPMTNAHSLPPPPISFARRRAEQLGSAKKKPADILISPRDTQAPEQFQPAIQSAPPIQTTFNLGSMALPRLPTLSGGDNIRRIAGNVPPTPTRFSMHRSAPNLNPPPSVPSISGRSPPAPSVPIATNLVPPTPGTGISGDKAAFLAPFEMFYDALHDSKQLKSWLGEQLQRSNSMIQTLAQQQEKMNDLVESLVEKRVAVMRNEMTGLHRRVEELEEMLRVSRSQGHGTDCKHRNGIIADGHIPSISSSAIDSSLPHRVSPKSAQDKTHRDDHQVAPEVDMDLSATNESSVPSRRAQPSPSQSSRPTFTDQTMTPPQGFREPLPSISGHTKSEHTAGNRHSASSGQSIAITPSLRRSSSRQAEES